MEVLLRNFGDSRQQRTIEKGYAGFRGTVTRLNFVKFPPHLERASESEPRIERIQFRGIHDDHASFPIREYACLARNRIPFERSR